MRKILIIGNPTSGKGRYLKYLTLVKERLDNEGISYASFATTATENAEALLVKYFDESFTDIIAIGGDGTINETVNGMSREVPLGIIAAGTGNDYVKCFDLGNSINEKVDSAIFGDPFAVDLGLCNNRKFINGVGVGFDGQIVADLVTKKTWLKGVLKYYYHVLKILGSYKVRSFNYRFDNKKTEEEKLILLCVAKGTTFGGGFKLTPHAQVDDEKLAVCTIADLTPLSRFLNIHHLQNGNHGILSQVRFDKTENLSIERNDLLEAHIDGEYFGRPPFKFSIIKKGLQVRARKLS